MSGAVLVTGATGTVGRAVVQRLADAGVHVRAGVRDPGTSQLPDGVDAVPFYFDDPATAEPALAGVDRLFLMRPPAISDVRTALTPLVDAAARHRVRRVVVLSVMGVNPALPHWRMERMVRAAGLSSTALRPAYFAQNLINPFGPDIRDRSEIRVSAGSGRMSFVDTRDIGAVAAAVLTDPDAHPAGPVTLTGPQALTFGDAAELLTAELGRPVRYVGLGLVARYRELRAAGSPPAYARVQLVIDATTRLGLAARMTPDLARMLGRPPTTLAEFIHDERDAWAASASAPGSDAV